jgi:DNA-directed RNA polymerase subunit M/transcription elongation factor TFIIS
MASRAVAEFSFTKFLKQIEQEFGDDKAMVKAWYDPQLSKARNKFFGWINTNPCTRMQGLVDAFNTICAYRKRPKRWLKYFKNPPFLDKCIPSMKVLAKHGDHILMIQNRYLPPPQLTPVDLNTPVKEQTLSEREDDVKRDKMAIDTRAGFINILTSKELSEGQFICKKCGKKGAIDYTTRMTRRSDEDSTVMDMCSICVQGSKT